MNKSELYGFLYTHFTLSFYKIQSKALSVRWEQLTLASAPSSYAPPEFPITLENLSKAQIMDQNISQILSAWKALIMSAQSLPGMGSEQALLAQKQLLNLIERAIIGGQVSLLSNDLIQKTSAFLEYPWEIDFNVFNARCPGSKLISRESLLEQSRNWQRVAVVEGRAIKEQAVVMKTLLNFKDVHPRNVLGNRQNQYYGEDYLAQITNRYQ